MSGDRLQTSAPTDCKAAPAPSCHQLEVLAACLDTGSVKETAHQLGISYDYARHTLAALYLALEVTNMAQAVEKLSSIEPDWRARGHKLLPATAQVVV